MTQRKIVGSLTARASRYVYLVALLTLLLAPSAQAAEPFHPRTEALDVTGLNHACGSATDNKGDLYLSSAGDDEVRVYNPAHELLTSIEDTNTPCGLAVTTTGVLYVSEQATGEVVRFKPNAYPFEGTPVYGSREVIDASTEAKGIATDPFDNRLYVAEGERVTSYGPEGEQGIDEIQRVNFPGATGGSFKLSFEGQETAPVEFGASEKALAEALEALSTIDSGDVSVEKTLETRYFVTFVGALGHKDVAMMVGDGSELIGTTTVQILETTKGWNGHIGEGVLSEATGVASYTAEPANFSTDRSLWVADGAGLAADRLYLFGGQDVKTLSLHRELDGAATPDGSLQFGAQGASLAADPGNVKAKKCTPIGEAACTAGHLYLYDAGHEVLDEFDGSGEYLDRTENAAFADAEPTQVVIDRSGISNDGTLYVTAGAGAGAKALAFGPLTQPTRAELSTPISKVLATAAAVATDANGYVYAAAGSLVHIYKPNGTEILTEAKAPLEDKGGPKDLAVDSKCNVYVLDGEAEVAYYAPSACPPVEGTTYTRHESAVAKNSDFTEGTLRGIAINPGPTAGKDHLFVTSVKNTHEYDSAANGSGLLDSEFGKSLFTSLRESIAVNGANGNVYFGVNGRLIYMVAPEGNEVLARMNTLVSTPGASGASPFLAVEQSSGHAVEFDGQTKTAHEYEPVAGGYVAEFGNFTEGLTKPYRVAIDNSCAINELSGEECEELYPANGTVYVAFDDSAPESYDVTAFGPLEYPEPAEATKHPLTVKETGSGSGTVTSDHEGIECPSECEAEFEEGTKVTLEASADEGSTFTQWLGCDSEPGGNCLVAMSEAKEVSAVFDKEGGGGPPLTINIEEGEGTVVTNPGGFECSGLAPESCTTEAIEEGAVTLTASPASGYAFKSWKGCDKKELIAEVQYGIIGRQCTINLNTAKEVGAKFVKTWDLTLSKTEDSGRGTLKTKPGGTVCVPNCTTATAAYKEKEGQIIEVQAKPAKHYHLAEYVAGTGDAAGCVGNTTCSFELTQDSSLEGKFELDTQYALSVSKTGGGQALIKTKPGGVSCALFCSQTTALFYEGEAVSVKWKLGKGTTSITWAKGASGCEEGSSSESVEGECTVTMGAPADLEAEFE